MPKFATVRAAANTSTGTQDFTVSGFGTPKAALFFVNYATADGTPAAHGMLSIGAVTGASNRWCVGINQEDNQSSSDTERYMRNTDVIHITPPGEISVDGAADFDSFITDGVRVNWSNGANAAYLVTCVLIGGAEISVHANHISAGNSNNLETDVTAPGFEPHLVLFAGCDAITTANSQGSNSRFSMGVAHWNGTTITQRAIGFFGRNAVSPTQSYARFRNTRVLSFLTQTGTVSWDCEAANFDSSGFSIISRSAAGSTLVPYLAIRFGSAADAKVGTYTSPTSTGSQGTTSIGFEPQFLLFGMSFTEAVDTAYSDNRGGTIGISAISATVQYSTSEQSQDAVNTSNDQSVSAATAVELPDHDGSAGLTASLTSLDSNGWTLNYTNVEAAGKLFWYVAFKAEAVSGGETVTSDPTLAVGETVNPTTIQGSIDFTPGATVALGQTVDPVAVLGSITITPAPAQAIAQTTDPGTVQSSITITPIATDGQAETAGPQTIQGALTIVPDSADALAETANPTIINNVTLTPDAANTIAATVDPTVILGSLTIAPDTAIGVGTTVDPTIEDGGDIVVIPGVTSASGATVDPTVVLGSLVLTPAEIEAIGQTVNPPPIQGSITVTPNVALVFAETVDPTIESESGLTITPLPAIAWAQVANPVVTLGDILVANLFATAIGATVDPAVLTGIGDELRGIVVLEGQFAYVVNLNGKSDYNTHIQGKADHIISLKGKL